MIKFSSSHLHLEPKEPSQNNFIWQNVISNSHQQLNSVEIVEIALEKKSSKSGSEAFYAHSTSQFR